MRRRANISLRQSPDFLTIASIWREAEPSICESFLLVSNR
jgi:hypothetical protein